MTALGNWRGSWKPRVLRLKGFPRRWWGVYGGSAAPPCGGVRGRHRSGCQFPETADVLQGLETCLSSFYTGSWLWRGRPRASLKPCPDVDSSLYFIPWAWPSSCPASSENLTLCFPGKITPSSSLSGLVLSGVWCRPDLSNVTLDDVTGPVRLDPGTFPKLWRKRHSFVRFQTCKAVSPPLSSGEESLWELGREPGRTWDRQTDTRLSFELSLWICSSTFQFFEPLNSLLLSYYVISNWIFCYLRLKESLIPLNLCSNIILNPANDSGVCSLVEARTEQNEMVFSVQLLSIRFAPQI